MLNTACCPILGHLNKKHLYLCLTKFMKKSKKYRIEIKISFF